LGDIIRIKEKYYVLASSALADDRTCVLKYGDTFGVFNRYGDIEVVGQGQLGLFHVETRHLDRMTIRLGGKTPLLLSSTVRDDNAFLSVDLTNVDIEVQNSSVIPRGIFHVYRSKFLGMEFATNSCAWRTMASAPLKFLSCLSSGLITLTSSRSEAQLAAGKAGLNQHK